MKSRVVTTCLLVALVLAPAAAAPQPAGPAPDAVAGEYVVTFAPRADKATSVTDHGGRIMATIAALDAYVVEFDDKRTDKGKELKEDKRLRCVEPDYVHRATLAPNDPR